MPTHEEMLALVDAAKERAATEVATWIPEKPGDHIAGTVVELGTITTIHGDYYTTTIAPVGGYSGLVNDERDAPLGDLIRVAWMGTVLAAQYLRMRPAPDDIVAFHYQKDVAPRIEKGNDYALIVAVVVDGITGKAKVPVDLRFNVPTEDQIANADPATGEIAGFQPGQSPLTPRPDEEPL
jgi:hypothetical protein